MSSSLSLKSFMKYVYLGLMWEAEATYRNGAVLLNSPQNPDAVYALYLSWLYDWISYKCFYRVSAT